MTMIETLLTRAGRLLALGAVLGAALPASAQAQSPSNPTRLTEAMIAPCNAWLSVRSAFSKQPTGLSNFDFALSVPPYNAMNGVFDLKSTRMFIAEREREIPIMARRDEAGMRATIGVVLRGADYWDRVAYNHQFLCLLYVRRQQLTGETFPQPFPTPASVGYPGS